MCGAWHRASALPPANGAPVLGEANRKRLKHNIWLFFLWPRRNGSEHLLHRNPGPVEGLGGGGCSPRTTGTAPSPCRTPRSPLGRPHGPGSSVYYVQDLVLRPPSSSEFVPFLINSFASGHRQQRNRIALFKANSSGISWNPCTVPLPALSLPVRWTEQRKGLKAARQRGTPSSASKGRYQGQC